MNKIEPYAVVHIYNGQDERMKGQHVSIDDVEARTPEDALRQARAIYGPRVYVQNQKGKWGAPNE